MNERKLRMNHEPQSAAPLLHNNGKRRRLKKLAAESAATMERTGFAATVRKAAARKRDLAIEDNNARIADRRPTAFATGKAKRAGTFHRNSLVAL